VETRRERIEKHEAACSLKNTGSQGKEPGTAELDQWLKEKAELDPTCTAAVLAACAKANIVTTVELQLFCSNSSQKHTKWLDLLPLKAVTNIKKGFAQEARGAGYASKLTMVFFLVLALQALQAFSYQVWFAVIILLDWQYHGLISCFFSWLDILPPKAVTNIKKGFAQEDVARGAGYASKLTIVFFLVVALAAFSYLGQQTAKTDPLPFSKTMTVTTGPLHITIDDSAPGSSGGYTVSFGGFTDGRSGPLLPDKGNVITQVNGKSTKGLERAAVTLLLKDRPCKIEFATVERPGDAKKREKVAAAIVEIRAGRSWLSVGNTAHSNIGDEGAKAIAAALRGSSVTTLNLYNNNIGDEGAKAIAAALRGSSVTTLHLYNNKIGDEGAKAVAAALNGRENAASVTTLNLNDNNIGDEGAKAIAAALRESNVTTLALNNNKIGDEGAKALLEGVRESSVTLLW
jgi:hypothetical protein